MKRVFYKLLLFILLFSCVDKTELIFNKDTQDYYNIEFIIKDTMSEPFGGKMFIVYTSDTNWVEMAQFGEDLLCNNNALISSVDFYTDSTKSPTYSGNYKMKWFDAVYLRKVGEGEIVELLEEGIELEQIFPVYRHLVYGPTDKFLDPLKRKCEIDRQKLSEMVYYRKNYDEIVKMLDSVGMKVLDYIEEENYKGIKKYALNENYDLDTLRLIKEEINKIVNAKGKVKVEDFYNQDRYDYKKMNYIRSYTNEDVDLMVNIEFNPKIGVSKFVKIFTQKQAVDMNDKDWQDFFEQD